MGAAASGSVWLVIAIACGPACTKATDGAAVDSSVAPDPAATATAAPAAADAREPGSERGAAPQKLGPSSSAPRSSAASSSTLPPSPPPPARPLAEWMRGPASDTFDSGNLEAIAGSFERMAAWAPAGYANWRSIAEDGARTARAGNLDAVKAACRGCHAQYEARYRHERTNQPLPL